MSKYIQDDFIEEILDSISIKELVRIIYGRRRGDDLTEINNEFMKAQHNVLAEIGKKLFIDKLYQEFPIMCEKDTLVLVEYHYRDRDHEVVINTSDEVDFYIYPIYDDDPVSFEIVWNITCDKAFKTRFEAPFFRLKDLKITKITEIILK